MKNQQYPYERVHLNLMGFPIRSYVTSDAPRAFKYINGHGKLVYAGYGCKLVLAFVKKHNGTFDEIFYNETRNIDGRVLHRLIMDKEIDVTMHPYPLFIHVLSFSFPVNQMKICIMVPAPQEVKASLYNILPFESITWYSIFASIFVFFCVHVMVKLISGGKIDFTKDIIDSIGVIVMITPKIQIYNRSWESRVILVFIGLYGILVTNLYQTNLTSFYTTKVYEEKIETIEDMMRVNITIMVPQIEWIFHRNFIESKAFKNQFLPVDLATYIDHRNSFNTSYGYAASSDKILWLLEQQAFFERPVFRSPIYCYYPAYLMIGMQYISPYEEALDRVILQSYQGGLLKKWLKDSLDESVDAGIVKRRIVLRSKFNTLILENLTYFWILWGTGMILSVICYLIEICIGKLKG